MLLSMGAQGQGQCLEVAAPAKLRISDSACPGLTRHAVFKLVLSTNTRNNRRGLPFGLHYPYVRAVCWISIQSALHSFAFGLQNPALRTICGE